MKCLTQMLNKYPQVHLLGFIVFGLCCIYMSNSYLIHDFGNYYFGAKYLLTAGWSNAIYDARLFNFWVYEHHPVNLYVCYAPNPPSLALLYIPFVLFPPVIAKLLFNILSLIIATYALLIAQKYFKLPIWSVGLLPIVFLYPLFNNFLFGQPYLIIISLLLLGFIDAEKGNYIRASIYITITILLKVSPVLILIYFLQRQYFKIIQWVILFIITFIVLGLPMISLDDWMYYLTDISLPTSNEGLLFTGFSIEGRSFVMLLKNLFIVDSLNNSNPWIMNLLLFNLCFYIFKCSVFYVALYITRKNTQYYLLSLGVWLIVSLLFSPSFSSYALILLLPIYFSAINYTELTSYRWIMLVVLGLICNYYVLPVLHLSFIFYFVQCSLLLLLLFGIGLLLHHKTSFILLEKGLLILFLLVNLSAFFRSTCADKSEYLLKKEEHLLITNLYVLDNQLYYEYWAIEEIKKHNTFIQIDTANTHQISVIDNQIFWQDKQLTSCADHKIQPTFLNDSTIIYLSDKNRGKGFYTLRQLVIPKN